MTNPEKLNITEYSLRQHSQNQPDKTALILVDKIRVETRFSYAEIFQSVCKLTAGLNSLQLPKHSVIVIRSPITYDFLILFLAAIAANLVPIATLIALTKDELNFILKDSKARVIFQLGDLKLNLDLPANCRQIVDDEFQQLKAFSATDISPTTLFNDPAYIFYTSGSTGSPKGVLHAQRSIIGREPIRKYWLELTPNDIVMHTENICWTYSMLTGFLDPLVAGATTLIFTGYNKFPEYEMPPETWLKLIEHYKVTVLASSPDVYHSILNIPNLLDYKLPSLRIAASAGATLPESTQKRWQEQFHRPIYSALGMTELSTFISTRKNTPIHKNTIGKIQPGRKVSILPLKSGTESVPPNVIGMLAIHQSELGFMLGYVGGSNENKKNYRGDWFLTQDLVSADEEGYITYYGRADNVLNVSGGFRVSPIEIENVLLGHQDVEDVACGTVFDPESKMDLLVAYVVTQHPSNQLEQEIKSWAAQHLVDYKIPHIIYFVEKLPHNKRGKLMRNKLKNLRPLKI